MKILKNHNCQSIGKFKRAAETSGLIYFMNYEESDDNANVKVYSKHDLTLLSDNIFASNEFLKDAEEGNFTWISEDAAYNVDELFAESRIYDRMAVKQLTKKYGKSFTNNSDWCGLPVWRVKSADNQSGLFIIDMHENRCFELVDRQIVDEELKTEILKTVDAKNIAELLN